MKKKKAYKNDIVNGMNRTDGQLRAELNFRDLGGIPAEDGRHVKEGLIYRGGALYLYTEAELEYLRSLKIRTILDFRAPYIWKKKRDPDIGAVYARCDGKAANIGDQIDFSARGFGQTGADAEAQLAKLTAYYSEMPFGYNALHVLMRELKEGHAPLLFHCAKGKDRTGIAAMVVLGALGVNDEEILKDYRYSNTARSEVIENRLKEGRQNHPEDAGYMKLMYLREGVDPVIGQKVLETIRERCGDWPGYMEQEYGWSRGDLEQFRIRYLES